MKSYLGNGASTLEELSVVITGRKKRVQARQKQDLFTLFLTTDNTDNNLNVHQY